MNASKVEGKFWIKQPLIFYFQTFFGSLKTLLTGKGYYMLLFTNIFSE